MTTLVAVVFATAVVAPHAIDLRAAAPVAAAAVWFYALALRALVVLAAAAFAIVYLPQTELFTALAHWCIHAVVPLLAAHLGLDGHRLANAVVVLPAGLLALSLSSAALGIARAARLIRSSIRKATLGSGPDDSIVVGGPDVLLASAGLARPRVIVSAGALLALDDDELAAGLAHERGHIARRHHHVLFMAEIMRAVGRFVPGSRRAVLELRFHLERDADRWAVQGDHDPLALASAICKAADGSRFGHAVSGLTGGRVTERVDELMTSGRRRGQRGRRIAVGCLASSMAVLAFGLAIALPAAVLADAPASDRRASVEHCLA